MFAEVNNIKIEVHFVGIFNIILLESQIWAGLSLRGVTVTPVSYGWVHSMSWVIKMSIGVMLHLTTEQNARDDNFNVTAA